MNYRSLVNLADKAFNTFEKPKQIYKSRSEDRTISDAQQRLQAEFVGRSKSELTRYECGVLIFENGAVSDDAYLYFLPRLCEAVFFEGADEFLFYSHLQNIHTEKLSNEQCDVLEKLILGLKP